MAEKETLRWVVLWDVDRVPRSIPVGTAVDMADHVAVHLPESYGIPMRQDRARISGTVHGAIRHIRPGDSTFFDEVVLDLSRTFAVTDG